MNDAATHDFCHDKSSGENVCRWKLVNTRETMFGSLARDSYTFLHYFMKSTTTIWKSSIVFNEFSWWQIFISNIWPGNEQFYSHFILRRLNLACRNWSSFNLLIYVKLGTFAKKHHWKTSSMRYTPSKNPLVSCYFLSILCCIPRGKCCLSVCI